MIDDLYKILTEIGFTEPLHPPVTHMPIGLVAGALIFLLTALVFKKKNFVLTARHASILAFIFAFPTIILGVIDWIHFYHAVLIPPIQIKMALAAAVLIILGTGIILGSEVKLHSITMVILYALAFTAVTGLGYFGAGLVYGRGAGKPAADISQNKVLSEGQAVFTSNCQSCHANGGNIIVHELPLKTSVKLSNRNAFVSFIRNPEMPGGSPGQMPSFTDKQISDSDARALYNYVSAMAKKW